MLTASRSIKSTTQRIPTQTAASANSFAAQVRRSCCEPSQEKPFLSGEDSKTIALISALENDKTASTARRLGTKERIKVQSSFVKRMQLLIAFGLVAGITPTSTRRGSSQRILATAFYELGGVDAE